MKKQQHIEKLWKLNNCDLQNMEDIMECMNALNIQYGVRFKDVRELNEDDATFCTDHFKCDVADCFADKINSQNISFDKFNRLCELFLDFEEMYETNISTFFKKQSPVIEMIDRINQHNSETRFTINQH